MPEELNVIEFIRKHCRHVKGNLWSGKLFNILPWQYDLLVEMFGTLKPSGYRQYRYCYCEIPKKDGKALWLGTPIPTPRGWTSIKDIKANDILFDENGETCRVIATTPIQYNRSCYNVKFADGMNLIADAEHQWVTETYKPWYKKDIRTTSDISKTLKYQKGRNHKISLCQPLGISEKQYLVHPYILGVWLGDGNSRNAGITIHYNDYQILDKIKEFGYSVKEWKSSNKNTGNYLIGSNGRTQKARNNCLQANLRKLNLLKNKHIPKNYLRGSIKQRFDLIRGLMDTDGFVSKNGGCEFTTTNELLAYGFIELSRSLGFKPSCNKGKSILNGKIIGPKYRILFFAHKNKPIFYLDRKFNRQKEIPKKKTRTSFRKIIGVEKCKSVPVKCIQVDSPSGLFLAGEGMIPTHNSELAAAVALYMLCGDNEEGAEVYSAAGNREQAGLIFNVAAQMVRMDPFLLRALKIIDSQKRIVYYKRNSFYRVLSREAYTKHGLNPSAVIFDELHAQPNRDLWDVLTEGTNIARTQQVIFITTTAGVYDKESIGWQIHDKADKIKRGVIEDPEFLPILYCADPKEDWEDEKVWKKYNPSLGYIFDIDNLRTHYNQVRQDPSRVNNFLRFRLNRWVEQISRWLPMDAWEACMDDIDEEKLLGRVCYGGLDLSSSQDLTAFALIFPPVDGLGKWYLLCKIYIPEDNMQQRVKKDRVDYDVWVRQGWITATPGNIIDNDYIRRDINEAAEKYDLQEVAYDPWGAREITVKLNEEDGIPMVEHRQGFKSMSPPTKRSFEMVVAKDINVGKNPVLRWCATNMVVQTDAAENTKPAKDKVTERIDPIVASIMALGRGILSYDETTVYGKRGLISIGPEDESEDEEDFDSDL